MSTDNETMRRKIEESDLSPGRKRLALRLLEHKEQREAQSSAPVPAAAVAERDVSHVPLPLRDVPLRWFYAAVGASGLFGGFVGALIGSALS